MKKIIVYLALSVLSLSASAANIYGVTPSLVGIEGNGGAIYVGLTDNAPGCLYGGIYFNGGTIDDRKAELGVAMAAKLAGKTVRIDYTQTGGPGTICFGYSIYIE